MNLNNGAQNSNEAEHSLLRVSGKALTPAFPKENSTFGQAGTNKCDNDDTYVNELCKHFFNIPPNLSQLSCGKVLQNNLTEQCDFDISFVQAIVCLKSSSACVSQLSTKRLQQIFNRQWSTQDNHTVNEGNNEKQSAKPLECLNIEKPSTSKVIDTQDILTLTPQNVSNLPCNSPSGSLIGSLATPKEAQIDVLSLVSTNDINNSPVLNSSTQGKWGYTVRNKRRKESSSESDSAIPVMDEKLSYDSDFDMFKSETFDNLNELQTYDLKLDETTKCLTQPTSWNCAERAEKEAAKNTADAGNIPGNDFADILFSWEAPCTQNVDKNEQHKPTSPIAKQSDETNNHFLLNPFLDEAFITPNVITQLTPHNTSSSKFNYSPKNLSITPLDNRSVVSIDSKLDEPQNFNNFQTGNRPQSRIDVSNNNRSSFETKFDGFNKPNTPVSNVMVHNSLCDSAYSTEMHHYYVDETANLTDKNISYNNTRHCYNLRSCTKKETAMTSIEPSSVMYNRTETPRIKYKGQSSVKKYKRRHPRKWICAKYLDFTLESLNIEYIVLESARVILTTVSDEKMAEEYATYRCWKNNLIGEAVNAVLNMSNVLRLEGKPNICRKPIITTVTETLDKIATCVKSDKAYMSQVYRIQIILELCNTVSVCVAIIDHLIAKLKLFWSILSQETEIRQDTHGTIHQLHLVFYALNIALRKYRTVVPNDKKAAEIAIPHVADLWKMRYIEKKLQHAKLNVNDAEERWRTVLEDLTIASTKRFVQFAKKLLSLVHVLNSQQISNEM